MGSAILFFSIIFLITNINKIVYRNYKKTTPNNKYMFILFPLILLDFPFIDYIQRYMHIHHYNYSQSFTTALFMLYPYLLLNFIGYILYIYNGLIHKN